MGESNGAAWLLGIDQGTGSSRAVVFDHALRPVAAARHELTQHYPEPGRVEHDPEELWDTTLDAARQAIAESGVSPADIAGIGITNQRETTLVWDRATGECVYPAIVWQDRRTAGYCRKLQTDGLGSTVAQKTGLIIDPYFSATKLVWILENVPGTRRLAEEDRLAFGTVDAFLIWRFTGGRVHATDATNASRTMLFNIHRQQWDAELLRLLGIPESLLPQVRDCAADFGRSDPSLLGAPVPICGVAGDQQAALIGQAGLEAGMTKATFGTGCFVITHTGDSALESRNKLLTTVACRLHGQPTYALEGSIFVAGSAVKWLRDELRTIETAAASEAIAARTGVVEHVHVVPAFAGLGAPWWDPHARGAILGLTGDSGIGEIVTATLQAVAYQTKDLLEAMAADGVSPSVLRADGGMAANDWLLQFLADILDVPVERPVNIESTVAGAAFLAGLQCGIFRSPETVADLWRCDRRFEPHMDRIRRSALYEGWRRAVARIRSSG
ncbi:MAG TPA: glycerol kinase GlpK [Woeseiaceae bacterium]|jgi:glycerol kinase|nr:glycerol kinase GlpK [Woeseiaceae bacterium]